MSKDKGRSDYGGKSKGTIDIPKEKTGRGIPSGMPGASPGIGKKSGKGNVDSPSTDGNKGKLMEKGGKDSGNPPVTQRDD